MIHHKQNDHKNYQDQSSGERGGRGRGRGRGGRGRGRGGRGGSEQFNDEE
jgi:hypothetical protein